MKILCLIDSLGSGGAQRQLVELAKGFKEEGHKVSFFTYHDFNFFKPELDAAGIPVQTIIESNYLMRMIKIRKAIRETQPDAVLAFLTAASFMATFAGFPWRRWKLIVGERSANPKILKSLTLRFYRFWHLFTDYVVANSHANIDLVKRANPFLPDRKLKVIYNMVNIPEIPMSEQNSSNKTRIVVAASYRPVKNLDGLIKAVHLLPEDYKKRLRIDWYGNKISTKNIYITNAKKKINAFNLNDIIYLHEHTKQILEYFQSADFIALTSHYEGFPNIICEGMALKKPIISSRVSDVDLLLKEDVNGYLCNAEDPLSITRAIIKAIETSAARREEIGEKNSQIAKREFDPTKITDNYLKLFK